MLAGPLYAKWAGDLRAANRWNDRREVNREERLNFADLRFLCRKIGAKPPTLRVPFAGTGRLVSLRRVAVIVAATCVRRVCNRRIAIDRDRHMRLVPAASKHRMDD